MCGIGWYRLQRLLVSGLLVIFSQTGWSEVSRIEIEGRQILHADGVDYQYELITGKLFFILDPQNPGNQDIIDIEWAQLNPAGLVEFSADFQLHVPQRDMANGTLVYVVNNRGEIRTPPGDFPADPIYKHGFTFLQTGWINELEVTGDRLLLNAPLVGSESEPITGMVRYEVVVNSPQNDVNIADDLHLAYEPTASGLQQATLTHRVNQLDPRISLQRSDFDLQVTWPEGRNQPRITLNLEGGLQAGHLYELIYEARDPVLAGAGMAGIRDIVSLFRSQEVADSELSEQLSRLNLPSFERTIATGNSQSGRLLRQFLYDGFNRDLPGRRVFDGVVPVITGAGRGMFNMRFSMPTRTNGQHQNQLYPNDLFPFTYGVTKDPFTGREDSILSRAMESDTVPRIMHIQTSNEYWLRGGSLVHTDPLGIRDIDASEGVRYYTIGGSQHGSESGIPEPATTGQLVRNPNLWTPIRDSLLVAMHRWLAEDRPPPPSRYPKIADSTLVPSHLPDGSINPDAWSPLPGINHPKDMYRVGYTGYGDLWPSLRIVSQHPQRSDRLYGVLVPAVDRNNNDFVYSTILPPLAQVPLATFVPWNLRAFSAGAETELLRLAGGYVPFARSASESTDFRDSIAELYTSFDDYLSKYEAATDNLITEGYLLPDYKVDYMDIARRNRVVFN